MSKKTILVLIDLEERKSEVLESHMTPKKIRLAIDKVLEKEEQEENK